MAGNDDRARLEAKAREEARSYVEQLRLTNEKASQTLGAPEIEEESYRALEHELAGKFLRC